MNLDSRLLYQVRLMHSSPYTWDLEKRLWQVELYGWLFLSHLFISRLHHIRSSHTFYYTRKKIYIQLLQQKVLNETHIIYAP